MGNYRDRTYTDSFWGRLCLMIKSSRKSGSLTVVFLFHLPINSGISKFTLTRFLFFIVVVILALCFFGSSSIFNGWSAFGRCGLLHRFRWGSLQIKTHYTCNNRFEWPLKHQRFNNMKNSITTYLLFLIAAVFFTGFFFHIFRRGRGFFLLTGLLVCCLWELR